MDATLSILRLPTISNGAPPILVGGGTPKVSRILTTCVGMILFCTSTLLITSVTEHCLATHPQNSTQMEVMLLRFRGTRYRQVTSMSTWEIPNQTDTELTNREMEEWKNNRSRYTDDQLGSLYILFTILLPWSILNWRQLKAQRNLLPSISGALEAYNNTDLKIEYRSGERNFRARFPEYIAHEIKLRKREIKTFNSWNTWEEVRTLVIIAIQLTMTGLIYGFNILYIGITGWISRISYIPYMENPAAYIFPGAVDAAITVRNGTHRKHLLGICFLPNNQVTASTFTYVMTCMTIYTACTLYSTTLSIINKLKIKGNAGNNRILDAIAYHTNADLAKDIRNKLKNQRATYTRESHGRFSETIRLITAAQSLDHTKKNLENSRLTKTNSIEETVEQPTPQNSRADSGVHTDTPVPESVNTTPRLSTTEPATTEGENGMKLTETTIEVTIEPRVTETEDKAAVIETSTA